MTLKGREPGGVLVKGHATALEIGTKGWAWDVSIDDSESSRFMLQLYLDLGDSYDPSSCPLVRQTAWIRGALPSHRL